MKDFFQSKVFHTVTALGLLFLISVSCFLIMKPFIIPMFWGIVVGFTVYGPITQLSLIFKRGIDRVPLVPGLVGAKIRKITVAGMVSVLFLVGILSFSFIAKSLYHDMRTFMEKSIKISELQQVANQVADKMVTIVNRVPTELLSVERKLQINTTLTDSREIAVYLKQALQGVIGIFQEAIPKASGFGGALVHFFLNVYIFLLFLFGLVFSNPDRTIQRIIDHGYLTKITGLNIRTIYQDFKTIIDISINVVLENSVLQGSLYFLGLWISGDVPFHYCVLLGIITTIFTLLPAVGSSVLILPTFIIALLLGNSQLAGIMLVVQVLCFIDEWYLRQIYSRPFSGPIHFVINLCSPAPSGDQTLSRGPNLESYELPAVFYLISQIGGFSLFGLSGFIFGPIFFMMVKMLILDIFRSLGNEGKALV